jgi:hypothetical protein
MLTLLRKAHMYVESNLNLDYVRILTQAIQAACIINKLAWYSFYVHVSWIEIL